MFPQDIVPDRRQSYGRKHLMEDDNTFLPPALSSYSIALLNERTSASHTNPSTTGMTNGTNPMTTGTNGTNPISEVTGIYDLDFPDNKSRSRLKDKLSVHFKESMANSHHEFRSRAGSNNGDLSQSGHNSSINSPSHSHSNQNSQNLSNHNSQNLSNHNSNHSFSQHSVHTANDEMDVSARKVSSQSSGADLSGSFGGDSKMPPVKRLRGSRRFGKLLGPPQRASKVITSEPQESMASPLSSKHFSPNISKLPIYTDNDLNLEFLGKDKELELRRRIEEQKLLNRAENHVKSNRSSLENQIQPNHSNENDQKIDGYKSPYVARNRAPLIEIPANSMNQFDSSFKKPRLPKPITPENHNSPDYRQNPYENYHQPQESKYQKPEPQEENRFNQVSPKYEPERVNSGPLAIPPAVIHSINSRKPERPQTDSDSGDIKKKKTIGINGNQYEKLELLGRGGTSKVYRVKLLSNNRLYAIKKVTFDQFDDMCVKGFKGEIDLLLKLRDSPRVVKLVDYAIGEGSIYLVMECGEIDLAHVFQSRFSSHDSLDLNFVKFYAIEMLKCVEAVHKAEIVHSDLKPANFLFVKGILKIIDFGIANAVPDHTANIYRESQIGTPNYMAPEALIDINQSLLPMKESTEQKNTWKVGKPSDVWSCGCIIYQMIYGKPPYGGYSGNQRIMAIMNPQVKIQYPETGIGGIKVPQSAVDLMQNCLARIPDDRWTVELCLTCDFLKPKVVSEAFIRDLVHLTVNFGYRNRVNGSGTISADVYDRLVETVLKEIDNLNFS